MKNKEEGTFYKIVDGKFVEVNIDEELMESEREANDPTIPKYTQEEFEKIMESYGYKRTHRVSKYTKEEIKKIMKGVLNGYKRAQS